MKRSPFWLSTLLAAALVSAAPADPRRPSQLPSAQIEELSQLERHGRWQEAYDKAGELMAREPKNGTWNIDRAISLRRMKREEEAVEELKIGLKKSPNYARGWQQLGAAYVHLHKYREAVDACSKCLKTEPANPFALRDRGVAYAKLGQFDAAQKDADRHWRLVHAHREYQVAREQASHGDYFSALNTFTRAMSKDTQYTPAIYRRAMLYEELGLYKEAIKDTTAQLKERPDSSVAFALRAVSYLQNGEPKLALADANAALKLEPGRADCYYVRARANSYLDHIEQAIKDYTRAIELEPPGLAALMERADMYMRLKEYKKAVADYSLVLEKSPKEEAGYHRRSEAYIRLNQFTNAVEDLRKLVALCPDDEVARMEYADALALDKKYKEAIDEYSSAIKIDPGSHRLYNRRAAAFARLGQKDLAARDHIQADKVKYGTEIMQWHDGE